MRLLPILTFLTFLDFVISMHTGPVDAPFIVARRVRFPPFSSTTSTPATTTTDPFSTSTGSGFSSTLPDIPTSTSDTIASSSPITVPSSPSSSSEPSPTSRPNTKSPDSVGTSRTPRPPKVASTSDGSFTVTAVVSGPSSTDTTGDPSSASSKNGFFANKGAVAGTFLVVGLFGAAFLLCASLWVLRKYRRHRKDQDFDEEYREFNSDRNGNTPEPTLPALHDSGYMTPIPPSPALNMIERLHGTNKYSGNMHYNSSQGQYRPESGDFDPYKVHDAADTQHTETTEQGVAYAYEPHVASPPQHQTILGRALTQQQYPDSS